MLEIISLTFLLRFRAGTNLPKIRQSGSQLTERFEYKITVLVTVFSF